MNESAAVIKQCCATTYASPWISLVLGESWHPGGLELTEHLGHQLALTAQDLVTDVAAGEGASACHLARRFGCRVQALDIGADQVQRARQHGAAQGLETRVTFQEGDAESLPWADRSVDAVVCECALCTFPSPEQAVREWARVLKPGGRVGITDVTRRGPLPPAFDNLAGWVGCLAGARPLDAYAELLRSEGFTVRRVEDRSSDLTALVTRIGHALVAWLRFQGSDATLGGWSRTDVERTLRGVLTSIDQGELGYGLVTAWHPA